MILPLLLILAALLSGLGPARHGTPNMCFVAGTKIHAREGLKSIEQVRAGDTVLSRNPETGEQGFKPVLRTFVTHPARLYHLTFRAREGQAPTASAEAKAQAESLLRATYAEMKWLDGTSMADAGEVVIRWLKNPL